MTPIVSAASLPPLQKTQEPALSGVEGTGHPRFRFEKGKSKPVKRPATRLVVYASLSLLAVLALFLDLELYAQERTAETVGFCQLISQLDKYRGNPVILRVRVKIYRHGTSISDRACPKQSLVVIADQTALQTNALSHFYQFLAKHRQTSKPIFATITGRLVNGEDGGFVLKRRVVFKLESVSEISEGG